MTVYDARLAHMRHVLSVMNLRCDTHMAPGGILACGEARAFADLLISASQLCLTVLVVAQGTLSDAAATIIMIQRRDHEGAGMVCPDQKLLALIAGSSLDSLDRLFWPGQCGIEGANK